MANRILNILDWLDRSATENCLVRACEICAAKHPDWKGTFCCTNDRVVCLEEGPRRVGAEVHFRKSAGPLEKELVEG